MNNLTLWFFCVLARRFGLFCLCIVLISPGMWAGEHEAKSAADQTDQDAYRVGNLENQKGNLEAAIAEYTEAIRLNPNACMAYAYRGAAYARMGKYEKALSDYTAAIDLKPDTQIASSLHSERGYLHKQEGQLAAAISDLNEAIELNPKNEKAFLNRGGTLNAMGDLKGAVADFAAAIEIDPSNVRAYGVRSMVRANLKDFDGALADIAYAIKLDPNNPVSYLSYGYILRKKRDYPAALKMMTRAIELEPTSTAALSLRATISMETGAFEEMFSDINKILKLNPDFPQALLQLGAYYFIKGEWTDALACYRKAESLGISGDQRIYAALKIYLLSSRLDQTPQETRSLVLLAGESEGWTKTICRYVSGELLEKDLLDEAGRGPEHLIPTHRAKAYFYIGEVAVIKNDLTQARRNFEQCIDTDAVDVTEYYFAKAELKSMNPSGISK